MGGVDLHVNVFMSIKSFGTYWVVVLLFASVWHYKR